MNTAVAAFLGRHNFSVHQDINAIVDAMLYDFDQGLKGKKIGSEMIRTFTTPPSQAAAGKSVIVIDAGGTNFRSCLVSFDAKGTPSISNLEKTSMPGIQRELSKKEFFDQIASNLEHLKGASENIGFCFSYPVTILEDGDGVLINFTKEVKAPEVEGCTIGKELAAALKEHGWTGNLNIRLLNDTVSALLAGAADVDEGMEYSSYVGFILGTGMNGAYIQNEDSSYPGLKKQIINCECGKFDMVARSDFDYSFDKKSDKPGIGIMEKLCSGAYLGPVAYEMLVAAGKEKLFADDVSAKFASIDSVTTIDVSTYLVAPHSKENKLGAIICNASDEDQEKLFVLLDCLVERCARMAASILASCVIKSGEGKNASKPVCILCNGSTFFKLYKVQERVKGYLEDVLVKQRGIYFDIISRENDITLGTAIGGLIR